MLKSAKIVKANKQIWGGGKSPDYNADNIDQHAYMTWHLPFDFLQLWDFFEIKKKKFKMCAPSLSLIIITVFTAGLP